MFFLNFRGSIRSTCGTVALAVALSALAARAQVAPSGTEPVHVLWVGAEYSDVLAGFPYQSNQRLSGIGGFASLRIASHLYVQGEARFLRFNSFYGETEDNYLGGPRYALRRFGKFQPFAQCLAGIGKIQFPFQIGSGNYFAVAPGGGANYRVAGRWSLTGEYEYQFWPGSTGAAGEPSHSIDPNGFHAGVAFRLRR